MTPHQHPLCNDILRAPAGSTDCDDLHIMRANGYVWSFWQPNAEELAAIVMGGSIALAVQGGTHPPLSVNATTPPVNYVSKATTPEESAAITEAIRGRYTALVTVAKRMASMLAKNTTDTPERAGLFDRLIDIVTLNVGAGEVVRGLPDDEPEATSTDAEVERLTKLKDAYFDDAMGWKAEAERWRKVAEGRIDPGLLREKITDAVEQIPVPNSYVEALASAACEAEVLKVILALPELNPNHHEG